MGSFLNSRIAFVFVPAISLNHLPAQRSHKVGLVASHLGSKHKFSEKTLHMGHDQKPLYEMLGLASTYKHPYGFIRLKKPSVTKGKQ